MHKLNNNLYIIIWYIMDALYTYHLWQELNSCFNIVLSFFFVIISFKREANQILCCGNIIKSTIFL